MFLVKHTDVWDLYKKEIDCFWKAEDIDLSRDYVDWLELTGAEFFSIKMGLAKKENIFLGTSFSMVTECPISKSHPKMTDLEFG